MRAGQFNNRKPRNVVRAGKHSSGSEFNTSFKRERHPEPPQFPTSRIEEWKQFSEMRDARPNQSGSSRGGSSKSRRGKRSGSRARRMTKVFVRQAVGMLAGAVVVTNTYQVAVAEREAERAKELDPPATAVAMIEPSAGIETLGGTPSAGGTPEQTSEARADGTPDDATSSGSVPLRGTGAAGMQTRFQPYPEALIRSA